jgi:DNA-binding PadR family transcriptional regulator
MTYPTAMVLQALASGRRYGFEIADVVGLRPGSVYQVLRRLEDGGYVDARWEDAERAHDEGRPPRRYYRLVHATARPLLAEARSRFPSLAHVPAAGRASEES